MMIFKPHHHGDETKVFHIMSKSKQQSLELREDTIIIDKEEIQASNLYLEDPMHFFYRSFAC